MQRATFRTLSDAKFFNILALFIYAACEFFLSLSDAKLFNNLALFI